MDKFERNCYLAAFFGTLPGVGGAFQGMAGSSSLGLLWYVGTMAQLVGGAGGAMYFAGCFDPPDDPDGGQGRSNKFVTLILYIPNLLRALSTSIPGWGLSPESSRTWFGIASLCGIAQLVIAVEMKRRQMAARARMG